MTDPTERQSIPALLRPAAAPFVLAAVAIACCYAAAGMSLGFFLGPVVAVTLILPVMMPRLSPLLAAIFVAGTMVDTIGIAWLLAVPGPQLTFPQWLACYVVLAAYAFALLAATRALTAPVAFILGLLWLAWPVWTSPFLTVELARWLTPAHPLMATNRVVLHMGAWLEQPLMYRHTTLNQDVPYTLPRSIWPCVFVHVVIGLLLLTPAWLKARSSRRRAAGAGPAVPA